MSGSPANSFLHNDCRFFRVEKNVLARNAVIKSRTIASRFFSREVWGGAIQ